MSTAPFLPGKNLDLQVVKQVQTRQKLLGATDIRLDENSRLNSYSFFTEKMPWIRLTSSVNINGSDNLAKTNILSNGIQAGHNNSQIPGYEMTSLGYRPKPGVISMDLTTHNRYGSLRTATVRFKVFSVEQLNVYERLYMSPGYSALLEWGHSKYLDSDTNTSGDVIETINLFRPGLSFQQINEKIVELRRKYFYNYDGLYGLMKNFSWSINQDGSYDCSVDIVSTGYILESMRISVGILQEDIVEFLRNRTQKEIEERQAEQAAQQVKTGEQVKLFGFIPIGEETSLRIPGEEEGDREFARKLATYFTSEQNTPLNVNLSTDGNIPESPSESLERDGRDFTKITPEIISADGQYASGFTLQYYVNGNTPNETPDTLPKEGLYTIEGIAYELTIIPQDKLYPKRYENKNFFGSTFFKKLRSYSLTIVEDSQTSPETTPIGDSNTEGFLVTVRKFNRELHTRIHYYIHQILKEIREDESFDQADTSFYREYESSFLSRETKSLIRIFDISHTKTAAKYININSNSEESLDRKYQYIQLGLFLNILNKFLPRDQNDRPLFIFDTRILGSERDFKTLNTLHCSVDPSICLLPDTQQSDRTVNTSLPGSTGVPPTISGIFLEKNYLYDKLDQYLEKGELRVFELINTLLDDIVRVTGRVNDFDLQYYQDSNSYRIIDRNFLDISITLPELQIFGKNSFVRELNLTSRLTPGIGTQLAIAAQANPTSNAIEGSAWSTLNRDLKDRIIQERKDEESKSRDQSEEKDAARRLQEKFADVFEFLNIVYPKASATSVSDSIQSLGLVPPNVIYQYVDFCQYQFNTETQDLQNPKKNNFLIPYVLELTVEGISGFTVMDSFIIPDTIIPDRYKGDGGIGFLITGIKHNIDQTKWITTIQSQIYNLDKGKKRKANYGTFTFNPSKETLQLTTSQDQELVSKTPWSAAFISFMTAQIGTQLSPPNLYILKNASHVGYANQVANLTNTTTPQPGWKILDPRITLLIEGDIIIENRENNNMTFSKKGNFTGSSHGDIVVAVEDTTATIIGGNIGNRISKRRVQLSGRTLNSPNYFAILRSTAGPRFTGPFKRVVEEEFRKYSQYDEIDPNFLPRVLEYLKFVGIPN
jgi:hypothetical protein